MQTLHYSFVHFHICALLPCICHSHCRHLVSSSSTWCPQTGTCPWPVWLPLRIHLMSGMESSTSQVTGVTRLHGSSSPLVVSSQHVHFHKAGKELCRDICVWVCMYVWFIPCKSLEKSIHSQGWGLVTPHQSTRNPCFLCLTPVSVVRISANLAH